MSKQASIASCIRVGKTKQERSEFMRLLAIKKNEKMSNAERSIHGKLMAGKRWNNKGFVNGFVLFICAVFGVMCVTIKDVNIASSTSYIASSTKVTVKVKKEAIKPIVKEIKAPIIMDNTEVIQGNTEVIVGNTVIATTSNYIDTEAIQAQREVKRQNLINQYQSENPVPNCDDIFGHGPSWSQRDCLSQLKELNTLEQYNNAMNWWVDSQLNKK